MFRIALISVAIFSFVFSCSPGPRRTLTQSEKMADMYWMYSKFDQNYAPREMKEALHSFNYEEIKKQYLEKASNATTNEEFYQVMMQFVAEFKDAHTSADIPLSNLPGRSKIAYLGFTGTRIKNYYHVKKLLPTIQAGSNYPIKVDDQILKIDGIPMLDFVDSKLIKNRNLGLKQANYSALMGKAFTRRSFFETFPEKQDVVLTIKRAGVEQEVTLPWIIKDFVTFRNEQTKATQKTQAAIHGANYKLNITDTDFQKVESLASLIALKAVSLEKVTSILKSNKDFDSIYQNVFENLENFELQDSFKRQKEINVWTFVDLIHAYLEPVKLTSTDTITEMRKTRYLPTIAHHVPHTKTYKAYTTMVETEGKTIKIGVIRLHSFSPGGSEPEIINEFKKTLKYFMDWGVEKVIIDLLDNGGGSLTLGTKLAQAMSSKKIDLPTIQLKINETWLDNFEQKSLSAPSDSEKEIARRTFQTLLDRSQKSRILSQDLPVTALFPLQVHANTELKVKDKVYPFDFLLLVNEMCASMCDIFTAMIQDNNLGTIMGSKTMGAGGNVTSHMQAPNSGLIIRQTESLLVRSREQKDYLENNGVEPDVKIEPYNMKANLYYEVIEKAFKHFKDKVK